MLNQKKEPINHYRYLEIERVSKTINKLEHRINERLPDVGLVNICKELQIISGEVKQHSARFSRPIWKVRLPIGGAISVVIGLCLIFFLYLFRLQEKTAGSVSEFLQGFDGLLNGLFLILMLVFFLVTLESRIKRSKIVKALQELRAMAHVVDMHQLTKDPTYLLNPDVTMTPSSPLRTLSKVELVRYLDYCAELLALIGKLAAYYAQRHEDHVVHDMVNDIEMLTSGLAHKIWQKIAVIQGQND